MSRDENEKELLQRALRDRSHTVDGAGVGFDDVLRSARGIRRRRRIVTGAAGLAVVAVVVPFGISLAGSNEAAPLPAASNGPTPSSQVSHTTTSPSPTTAPSTATAATTHTLDVAGATQGAAPTISYADGTTIHSYDGQTVTMPNAFTGFMEWRGDWLLRGQESTSLLDANSLQTIDSTGRVLKTQPTWGQFWKSPDGVERAWSVAGAAGKDGTILSGPDNTMGEGGPSRASTPPEASVSVVGMAAGALIYELSPPGSETQVWGVEDQTGAAIRLPISGKTPVDATLAHGGLIALNDQNRSCTSMVMGLAATQLWSSCDYTSVSFSPSGSYLLAEPSSSTSSMVGEFDLLDARTGAPVGSYRLSGTATFTDIAWENDDSHLLISVYDHGEWTMDRVSVGGSIERALGPVAGTPRSDGPWVFEAIPNR
ncbi:MAG: hypothetical protein ACRDPI_04255 [Nocardioidaceae bacterium]